MKKIKHQHLCSSIPGPCCRGVSNILERVWYFLWTPGTQQEAAETFARQMLADGPAPNSPVTSHLHGNDTTITILELHPTSASASRRYWVPDGRNPTRAPSGLNCSFYWEFKRSICWKYNAWLHLGCLAEVSAVWATGDEQLAHSSYELVSPFICPSVSLGTC